MIAIDRNTQADTGYNAQQTYEAAGSNGLRLEIVRRNRRGIMRFRYLSLAALLPTLVFMMLLNAESVRFQGKGQNSEQITKFDVPDSLTHGIPIRTQDNIFLDNSHCPSAKLDIWFSQGSVSSMLFVPGVTDDPIQRALQTSKNGISTYLIGPKDCIFKATVELVRNTEDGKR